jgi:Fibronectin type III domain
MTSPIINTYLTNDQSIYISWIPITSSNQTGAQAILSYSLESDQATGNWISIIGNPSRSLALNIVITTGITPGLTYSFRLRALNINGWGAYSTITTVIPSNVPSKMTPAISSIENTYVKI